MDIDAKQGVGCLGHLKVCDHVVFDLSEHLWFCTKVEPSTGRTIHLSYCPVSVCGWPRLQVASRSEENFRPAQGRLQIHFRTLRHH